MKPINTLLTILFISLLSSPSWSKSYDELVKREGLYYQRFTDVPYTGKVFGKNQGSFKNGEYDGAWVSYYKDGQLDYKGNYKNGEKDGAWVSYHNNGQLSSKGNYKNGEYDGAWVSYGKNGSLNYKGDYKNGEKDGAWVSYYDYESYGGLDSYGSNDQLESKGNYKNGKREGTWVSYDEDGTVYTPWTGTFKDGVKISD